MTEATLEPIFVVDKEGLRKLLARKGFAWMIPELVQNAWDERSKVVRVGLTWDIEPQGKGKTATGLAGLTVEDDDPDGFQDLTHAYTLFAESAKKDLSDKRGRFNVGEKLVVAACQTATIFTTTGTVEFTEQGRLVSKSTRDAGSLFVGQVPMSRGEFDECLRVARMLFPPAGIETYLNGELLAVREPLREFKATLRTPTGPTLKIRDRKTPIRVYEPLDGETPTLYEMGIPVVETGDRWHVDVGQKVPLNMDRDSVTPAYLRTVRSAVMSACHDLLDEDAMMESWVIDGARDDDVTPEALEAMLAGRYGEKVVAYSPSDPEANKIAVSQGFTVLTGGSLPKDVWANVKSHGLVKSAAQVTPSPRPEGERQEKPREQWTDGMLRHAAFVRLLSFKLMMADVEIAVVDDPTSMNFSAAFMRLPHSNKGRFSFNYRSLGAKFFDLSPVDEGPLSLTIHELGHFYESDHLSRGYYKALTDLGARCARVALDDPGFFEWALTADPKTVLDAVDVAALVEQVAA
jgi:hypothetical protein